MLVEPPEVLKFRIWSPNEHPLEKVGVQYCATAIELAAASMRNKIWE
jgi:hypothetical protein